MGARWYRSDDGGMKVSAEGANSIRVLLPHSGEQVLTLPAVNGKSDALSGKVLAQKIERLPEANWLQHAKKPLASASFNLESEISIPAAAKGGRALLLLEFPGRDHLPSSCTCLVNGRAATLGESSSASRIGYDMVTPDCYWRDLLPYRSQWTWHSCELPSGSSRVVFSGAFPYENCRMGLWAWADWDVAQPAVPLSIQCPEPAMPQYQAHVRRQGICLLSPGIGASAASVMS